MIASRYEQLRDAFMAERAVLARPPAPGQWWESRGNLLADPSWVAMVEASMPPCGCAVCVSERHPQLLPLAPPRGRAPAGAAEILDRVVCLLRDPRLPHDRHGALEQVLIWSYLDLSRARWAEVLPHLLGPRLRMMPNGSLVLGPDEYPLGLCPDLIARATVGTECSADCRCWHCEREAEARAESDAIDHLRGWYEQGRGMVGESGC